uniref:Uncharacterized protein n=1 Tax=Strombidium inclinatum TaxID=197538 RepID=A0A7S3IKG8_9SPIT|mmetsp:Transcript_24635/g.38289  ORF Transcript_24635/g.38289 Transcript_24635/m.38289 type:complete len:187 (+) Transcript_24635:781-1341(+)
MPMPNHMKEGWGIAYKNWVMFNNETNEVMAQQQLLYTTDSTSKITVIDPKNWKTLRQIEVTENGKSLNYLNELEIIQRDVDSTTPLERKQQYIRSQWVFANRFQSNFIYMVNLESGKVVHKWDMSEVVAEQYTYIKEKGETNYDDRNNVLNGIAYRAETDSFLVSGKRWDFVFDIKLDYHKYLGEV